MFLIANSRQFCTCLGGFGGVGESLVGENSGNTMAEKYRAEIQINEPCEVQTSTL